MAASVTWTAKTVWGNKRVQVGKYFAENGTDVMASGLKWLDAAFVTPATATNDSGVAINTIASSAGDFKLVTGTSGGTYHIMVIGN